MNFIIYDETNKRRGGIQMEKIRSEVFSIYLEVYKKLLKVYEVSHSLNKAELSKKILRQYKNYSFDELPSTLQFNMNKNANADIKNIEEKFKVNLYRLLDNRTNKVKFHMPKDFRLEIEGFLEIIKCKWDDKKQEGSFEAFEASILQQCAQIKMLEKQAESMHDMSSIQYLRKEFLQIQRELQSLRKDVEHLKNIKKIGGEI